MPRAASTDAPRLLLTRPRPQAERFAAAMRAAHPGLAITVAPLIEIAPQPVPADAALAAGGLIFTSENGVAGFAAGCGRRDLPAWCVGPRTAQAARAAGFVTVHQGGGDAAALISELMRARPPGPLVHLRGRHAARDIAGALCAAGLQARDLQVYDQPARRLDAAGRAVLETPGAVVVPLFSPRSARRLETELAGLALAATLYPVAISAAAAEALSHPHNVNTLISTSPDAGAVAKAVSLRIRMLETGVHPR